MTTSTQQTSTTNWMHRCPACKATTRVEWLHRWNAGAKTSYNPSGKWDHRWESASAKVVTPFVWKDEAPAIECACGAAAYGKRIVAVASEHECDERCTNAKGHQCECSCGGKNHGINYLPMVMA